MNDYTISFFVVLGLVLAAIFVVVSVIRFLNKPTNEQIENIKQWLLWAVVEAETALGSGTGALKLRYVYDMAVSRFPFIAIVPFDTFSNWVDAALDDFKEELGSNEKMKEYVSGHTQTNKIGFSEQVK